MLQPEVLRPVELKVGDSGALEEGDVEQFNKDREADFNDQAAVKYRRTFKKKMPQYQCEYEHCRCICIGKADASRHQRLWHGPSTAHGHRTKADRVLSFLDQFYTVEHSVNIKYECLLSMGIHECSGGALIDGVIVIPGVNLTILLEVQPHQHKLKYTGVASAVVRMSEVSAQLWVGGNTTGVVWLLFNPDDYTVDGVQVHTTIKERLAKLHALIQILTNTGMPTSPWGLSVMYMFFDTEAGSPKVFQDPEYHKEMQSSVTQVIV